MKWFLNCIGVLTRSNSKWLATFNAERSLCPVCRPAVMDESECVTEYDVLTRICDAERYRIGPSCEV